MFTSRGLIKDRESRRLYSKAIQGFLKTSVDSTKANEIRAVINDILSKGILPLSVYNQLKKELAAQGFSMAGNTVVDYKTDARSSKSYTIGVGGGLKDGMGNTVPMAR